MAFSVELGGGKLRHDCKFKLEGQLISKDYLQVKVVL